MVGLLVKPSGWNWFHVMLCEGGGWEYVEEDSWDQASLNGALASQSGMCAEIGVGGSERLSPVGIPLVCEKIEAVRAYIGLN